MMDDFFKLAAKVEGGVKVIGYKPRFDNPIEAARFNFAKGARSQIEAIKSGTLNDKGQAKGNLFEKLENGAYRISLKNGISTLKVVPGKDFFILKTAKEAAAFLEAAIAASDAGKFDDEYKATMRKLKSTKEQKPNVIDSVRAKKNGAAHS